MTATASQISRVRRMTAEPTTTTYSDVDIQAYIEAHPLVDSDGYSPDQNSWTATYDLNAAAADIWEEKSASKAHLHDYSADGGNYSRSQISEAAMNHARYYRSRRSISTIEMESTPKKDDDDIDTDEEA